MIKLNIKTPCRNICKLNDDKICIGCGRDLSQIKNWIHYNNKEQEKIIEQIRKKKISSGYRP